MAPLDDRFIMEMRSRPAMPPVVGFRCDMRSPSPADAEGTRDRGPATSRMHGATLAVQRRIICPFPVARVSLFNTVGKRKFLAVTSNRMNKVGDNADSGGLGIATNADEAEGLVSGWTRRHSRALYENTYHLPSSRPHTVSLRDQAIHMKDLLQNCKSEEKSSNFHEFKSNQNKFNCSTIPSEQEQ